MAATGRVAFHLAGSELQRAITALEAQADQHLLAFIAPGV